jgi:hypothetical protein
MSNLSCFLLWLFVMVGAIAGWKWLRSQERGE